MYFILSKVLYFLITPFYWIVVLFAWGLITKKPKLKKRLFIGSAVIFLVFSNPLLFRKFMKWWNYPVPNITNTYSCAIVLGGFVSEDARGVGFFNGACDRFIETAELKTTGKVSHILISSGNSSLNPDAFREADWAKKEFVKLNIPDTAVLIEDSSRNTIENATYSKKILDKKGLKPPYLLVTGAFHMRRAMYTFQKAGMPVVAYPAEYVSVFEGFTFSEIVPRPDILSGWETYIKEMVGITVVHFKKI